MLSFSLANAVVVYNNNADTAVLTLLLLLLLPAHLQNIMCGRMSAQSLAPGK